MQNKQERIAEDINRLILSIHKTASQQFMDNIRAFSRKTLGSYVRPMMEDSLQLKGKILSKLSEYSDSKTVLHCQESIDRFLSSNSVHKKAETLKMLLKLSDLTAHTQNLPIFKEQKKLNATALNQTQESFNASSLQFSRKPNSFEQLQALRNRGSQRQNITEFDILREITYVLQNIDGSLMCSQKGYYCLRSNIDVTETVKTIVSELSEIGWLYRRITQGFKEQGSITKALKLAIDEEMSQYYRWLAIIENMIKSQELTLRKLVLWSYEPFQKLKWLLIVLEAVHSYHGCQIISIINCYRPQGSTPINELLNRLLANLLQPLFQYVYYWVYKGELIDSKQEFFIEENRRVGEGSEWREKHVLLHSNIPNIIDVQSAKMIFKAGKTVYFLNNQCKCNFSLSVPFLDTKSILDTKMYESTSILSVGFKQWVEAVHQETNRELVKVMFQKFSLKVHLGSIKHFFLLGKGDFIQLMCQNLREELMKPKHQILQHTLDIFISQGINKCFPAEKEDKNSKKNLFSSKIEKDSYKSNFVNRLLAKKFQKGRDGWESFNFAYSLDRIQPVQAVLTPKCMANYQKIFHSLWKVKRVEQALKEIWISHLKCYPKNTQTPQITQILHLCHILRTSMTHFLGNLYSYFMIGIESAWDKFVEAVDDSPDFDSIIQMHQQFQEEVLEITLNQSKSKSSAQALHNLFEIIMKFREVELLLQEQCLDYFDQKKHFVTRQYLSQKINTDPVSMPIFNQGSLFKILKEIKVNYEMCFKTFYQLARSEKELKLNVLGFRLDFSEHYTHLFQ